MNRVSTCLLMRPWWSLLPLQDKDGTWIKSHSILAPASNSQSGVFALHLRLPWLASFQQSLILSLNICVWFLLGLFGLYMSLLVMCGCPHLHYLLNFSRTESPTHSLCLVKASHTDTIFINYSCPGCASMFCQLTPPPLCSARTSESHLLSFLHEPAGFPKSFKWWLFVRLYALRRGASLSDIMLMAKNPFLSTDSLTQRQKSYQAITMQHQEGM